MNGFLEAALIHLHKIQFILKEIFPQIGLTWCHA